MAAAAAIRNDIDATPTTAAPEVASSDGAELGSLLGSVKVRYLIPKIAPNWVHYLIPKIAPNWVHYLVRRMVQMTVPS